METLPELVSHLSGVASVAALNAEGWNARTVDKAVASGTLIRLRQGWVATPSAPIELVQSVRVGGVLSCVSVLHRYRVWCSDTSTTHISVARKAQRLSSPHDRSMPLGDPARFGLTVHRTIPSSLPEHTRAYDSIALALLHAIKCQPRLDAVATIDSVLNRNLMALHDVQDLFGFLPHRCQQYLSQIDGSSQSGLETKARLSLRRFNIAFRPQHTIAGVGSVDLLIGDRLVLEVDGWEFHSKRVDFENDRRRDLELARQGYRVLRASFWQVMNDWDSVFAVIRELIARGEHRWAPGIRGRRQTL